MRLIGKPYRRIKKFLPNEIDLIETELSEIDWKEYERHDFEQFAGSSSLELPYPIASKINSGLQVMEASVNVIMQLPEIERSLVVRAYYGRIPPGGSIGMHPDNFAYHRLCHRFHIPIKTKKQVEMLWEGEERLHMEREYLYEIDNIRAHGVINPTAEERIHFIVDTCRADLYERYLRYLKTRMSKLPDKIKDEIIEISEELCGIQSRH